MPDVLSVSVKNPILSVGRMFTGDYSRSHEYITEVQNALRDEGLAFIPNKVFGIYYDNPGEKEAEALRSFQGVFLTDAAWYDHPVTQGKLCRMSLAGRHLYVKATGDPMKALHDGYNALFKYIKESAAEVRSNTGYQILTYWENTVTAEIYMQLK